MAKLQAERIVALEENVKKWKALFNEKEQIDLQNRQRIAELQVVSKESDRRLAGEIEKLRRLQNENDKLVARRPGVTTLRDSEHEYKFAYHTAEEKNRANRLFTKEPGTIKWLSETLRPDDVFFDIGANIGVYTIFAGRRIGADGFVYGFEPHLPNATSLINNIEINALQSRVRVMCVPLSDRDAFAEFQYFSLNPSRAHSQLGRPALRGEPFDPVATELKYGCRLDSLVGPGLLPAPTVVKIDVDGLECEVVAGMRELLHSAKPPRSVQVELDAETYEGITAQMTSAGYRLIDRHWTESGQGEVEADPQAAVAYNAIFARP